MKNFKNIGRAAIISIGIWFIMAQNAYAQLDLSNSLNNAGEEIKRVGGYIINFLSILLGVIAAIRLIPIFVKRGKNEGQTSELLTDWGFTLIYVLLGLQIVKLVLLK